MKFNYQWKLSGSSYYITTYTWFNHLNHYLSNILFKDFYIVISTDTVKGIQVLLADTWYNYALY